MDKLEQIKFLLHQIEKKSITKGPVNKLFSADVNEEFHKEITAKFIDEGTNPMLQLRVFPR